MRFFEDARGTIWPIDSIECIRPVPDSRYLTHRVYFKGEDEFAAKDITDADVEFICRSGCPVLPAEPGTRLLTFAFNRAGEDADFAVIEEAVIGWRIDAIYSGPTPITLDYEFNGMGQWNAIQHPDGQLYKHDGGATSLIVWKADMERLAQQQRAAPTTEAQGAA